MNQIKRFRAGGWLPHDRRNIDTWVRGLKARVTESPQPLVPSIQELKGMVETDPVLNFTAEAMFKEAALLKQQTPLGTPEVKDLDDFLVLLNGIMTQAPEYTECPDSTTGVEEPCGLIGFPINALLDWPMATSFGYDFFANALVNQQFKKILNFWSEFLVSEASRAALVDSFPDRTPKVLAWLSSTARQEMVDVACQASDDPSCRRQPFEHFFNCDPSDEHYGFKSWDDFFTRTFVDGVRPVAPGDDVIANACESAPLQVVPHVSDSSEFWLKGQPYSLLNMMDFDPLAKHFIGGTVYQAFLSALSYHRWNSPVSGRVKKAFVVNGSYYLENRYQGFINPDGGDPSAPNDSQPFLTAVATRAVIFIEADNPKIGLMCFIAVGMSEVSSCEITVVEGQHLDKGDELGMFHFGGSTHSLIFRPQVKLSFDFHNTSPGLSSTNIPVRSRIATVVT
jgi:phosphatidylserine decarboxylase